MLSPEVIKKIKKVHIRTGRVVNTLMAGQFKSVFRGAGIEFEEVREYTPGDEVKNIDWKVSARLGRPFIKRHREERELIVILLVDMSASNRFGTTAALKMEIAAEIASILAFNAIRNNDKVGAILFTDRVEKYIPPKKGSGHVWRVIKELFTFRPVYSGTNIVEAVAYLGRISRKRTVAFLISDFLESNKSVEFARPLKTVSKKHELISVLLSDPGEFELPKSGVLTFQDAESGRIMYFDAANKTVRNAYEKQKRSEYMKTVELLKSADIDCIPVKTDDDPADRLTRYFRYREKRKR